MPSSIHPREALFGGERSVPILASCEHFAGSRKLIEKGFRLQAELGPIFDITCDLEDGAAAGEEAAHASMVAELVASPANVAGMAGVRIHDPSHPDWRRDIDIVLGGAGVRIAYLTVPKAMSVDEVSQVIGYVDQRCAELGLGRTIPMHVLIETHGALKDVWKIAALPSVEVIDFGLMDFVSSHNGALGAEAMRSPGQFEHKLIVRAKAEIVAAAAANGIVAAHNVCIDLKDEARIYDDAHRARTEYGFMRMWSIHPTQIQPIVRAMQPSFADVEAAAAILVAGSEAGWGPIQHEGTLHDRASYRYFWNLLCRARMSGVSLSEAVRAAFFGEADGGETAGLARSRNNRAA